MLSPETVRELRDAWLPNMTGPGLDRLIDLLDKRSPLLVHGCFTKSLPMGCLATHVAWNHPATEHFTVEAGINWLHRVAGLNPATSLVIRDWDRRAASDWTIWAELAACLRAERDSRQDKVSSEIDHAELVEA